jgi:hypothetical protein
MPRNSLQQFFNNANILRTKYGYDHEHFRLEVQAQLLEKQGLELVIVLKNLDNEDGKYTWVAVSIAKSPESALKIFERKLVQNTGKILDDVIFDEQEEDDL